jgi:putative N6-adenine-specific DNA methylase
VTTQACRFRYFVAVSPGLESLLHAELGRLGIRGQITPGGVECAGTLETLWAIHHQSWLAESARLRLRPFRATSFDELEQGLKRLTWHAYLRPGLPFAISVVSHKSRLYHTDAIAERVRRVIEVGWSLAGTSTAGLQGPLDRPQATGIQGKLQIRVSRDIVQVSIDASGIRLHRRGYRTHVGTAPLRETLGAAAIQLLLTLAPSQPIRRLWDPCCGSGTLLGEWLLMRSGKTRFDERPFAFESWPIHPKPEYAAFLERQVQPPSLDLDCLAFGSDIDLKSIEAARHNLAVAQVLERCELRAEDFRNAATRIPANTAVAANLPYGVRLQDQRASATLFGDLDRLLQARSDLRPVVVLNTIAPPNQTQGNWQRLATFANGGLRVNAWGLG